MKKLAFGLGILAVICVAILCVIVQCFLCEGASQNVTANLIQGWIENNGQIEDCSVKFYAKVPGINFFLCEDYIMRQDFRPSPDQIEGEEPLMDMTVLKQRKVSTSDKEWNPKGKKSGVVNFLIGDKSKHKTNCFIYESIEYKKYWGNKTLIEFQIDGDKVKVVHTVQARGDVALIQIENEGQNSMSIDIDGNLHMVFDEGLSDMVLSKPIAYQIINGIPINVSASFRLISDTIFGFTVGSYDNKYDLIIWYK